MSRTKGAGGPGGGAGATAAVPATPGFAADEQHGGDDDVPF